MIEKIGFFKKIIKANNFNDIKFNIKNIIEKISNDNLTMEIKLAKYPTPKMLFYLSSIQIKHKKKCK